MEPKLARDRSSSCDDPSTDDELVDEMTVQYGDESPVTKFSSSLIQTLREEDGKPVKLTFGDEEITAEDEVYIFHYPKDNELSLYDDNIDFKNLENVGNGKTLEIQNLKIFDVRESISIVLPSKKSDGRLLTLPLKGHIYVDKNFQSCDSNIIKDYQKDLEHEVSFPDDIKVRHPLLGADWENHISLANESIKKSNKLRKKFKNKKQDSLLNDSIKEVKSEKSKRERSVSETLLSPKKIKKKANN